MKTSTMHNVRVCEREKEKEEKEKGDVMKKLP
jgi:hypothetical protein